MMHSRPSSSRKVKKSSKKSASKKEIKKESQQSSELNLKPIKNEDLWFDIPSWSDICRVCLKVGTVPIYGGGGGGAQVNIADSIQAVSGIEISEDDRFPKFLCISCHTLLQAAVQFRKTAQETDNLLRQSKSENSASIDHADLDMDTGCNDDFPNNSEVIEDDTKKKKFYQCKKCEIQFDSWNEYSAHKETDEHKNARAQCPICKGYYAALYLKAHVLRHGADTERSYICDVCGKTFVIHNAFTRHRLTHGYDLPFKCDLCPYRGRFTESLKMHMRSHTGEKPYVCAECPRRFISKSNLNKHALTHKKEHDFKCQDCARGFYTKKELEMHFKVDHTGIKDQICNICGKAFGYRKQMMKHQKKVHKREKLRSGRMPLYLQVELKKQSELAKHS